MMTRLCFRAVFAILLMNVSAALAAPDEECIAPVSYLPLSADVVGNDARGVPSLGTYERISPDGRFVLRSYSGERLGQVSLIELPVDPLDPIKVFRTPLRNEAFPVQGTWRFLVDVDGRHFRFRDVWALQQQAHAVFQGGMRGFYAAASELDGVPGAPSLIWIRSMSWPQGDRAGQGTGPLQVRTIGVREAQGTFDVVTDTGPQFVCGARHAVDGGVYTLPMLSVDGREFSAIPINPRQGQPSMRVYGLSPGIPGSEHACDLRMDLKAQPGKAVFAFAGKASAAMLAYTDNASVYFVDRRAPLQDQVFRVDDHHTQVLASAFPGFTRDGRIVFGATWKLCRAPGTCQEQAGYVVADPYQNADYRQQLLRVGLLPERACVTRSDVLRERQRFAAERGLSH